MSKNAEQSFGAQLRKAQEYLGYIRGFVGYAPSREEETVQGFSLLVDQARSYNAEVASTHKNYQISVMNRKNAFKNGPSSLNKYIIQIKAAIESQYGRASSESKIINQIIREMRTSGKKPVENSDPELEKANEIKRISRSQLSYGSQIQFFSDIVVKLGLFPDYYSSNEALNLPQLQAFSEMIWNLHTELTTNTKLHDDAKINRKAIFKEVKDRIQRIKKYVKAMYGPDSNEYNQIKNL